MKFGWRFPILDGGKRQGINDSGIATFAGEDLYNNLAREICQNSLDAKDKLSDGPVVVSFSLKSIYKSVFDPIVGLTTVLKSCKDYWSSFNDKKLNCFLDDAFKTLSEDQLDLLVISDFNTIGLDGSKNRSGAWDALTGSNGVSYKTNGSQGSFGIGKNAPYACSNLRTVFYNTYSKVDNLKAFQGVTSLVTHNNDKGEETQGCGFYYNVNDRKPVFEEDNCATTNYFYRNEYGTDIIIVGFKKNSNWKDDIKLAILKNFFIAIIDKKLVVNIDDITIDNKTISKHLNDAIIANPKDNEIVKVSNYCQTYNNPDKVFECSILEDKDTKLYIKVDDSYTRSIACLRATGMLIKHKTIKKMRPYEAVLLVNGLEMNDLLKMMEPPKHDKWDAGILSEESKKQGRSVIRKIDKFIAESVESMCKIESLEEIDPDGVSSFLPDDTDFINNKGNKCDKSIVDPISEIENIKKEKPIISKENVQGSIGQGKQSNNGDVHNSVDSNEKWNGNVPKPGEIGEGDDKIVYSNPDGTKNFDSVVKAKFRVVPIKYDAGIYNFVFKCDKDYSEARFQFKCVGEDGSSENLVVLGFKENNKFIKINQNFIELKNIKKGQSYTITIKLSSTNRVLLSVGGLGNESVR